MQYLVNSKQTYNAHMQEGCRKDVEHTFGVQQLRWEILTKPVKFWKLNIITDVMITCTILHNMILEDEKDLNVEPIFKPTLCGMQNPQDLSSHELHKGTTKMEDINAHYNFCNDFVHHLWQKRENETFF